MRAVPGHTHYPPSTTGRSLLCYLISGTGIQFRKDRSDLHGCHVSFQGKLALHTPLVTLELGILGSSTKNLRMVTGRILRVLYGRRFRKRALKGEREAPGKGERPLAHENQSACEREASARVAEKVFTVQS